MEKFLKNVYESKKISTLLKWACNISVLVSLIGFSIVCYGAFALSAESLIKVLIIFGAPFLLVTLLRRALDMKRPYQVYGFYVEPPKNKSGHSFPSRHAFSSFVIGVTALFVYPAIGVVLLFFGVLLCICRVLLGIHFIRDVICGALIGAVCSILGVLIFAPF